MLNFPRLPGNVFSKNINSLLSAYIKKNVKSVKQCSTIYIVLQTIHNISANMEIASIEVT